ncbi:hypothetical protein [Paraburkholderia mimosarum]|uniref:hypothetical protein n=1 Tax=Paraburkholderia mimosarum TaxID=312026 RepID=UPI0005A8818A|nr:hypothetical protein [Paraburkholderia mimosarum]
MSTPERMLFATTHETSTLNLAVLNGQLFASLHELARLNMETCRLVFSGAGLHWENVLWAQTSEQLVRRQADTLPWLATQFAGYTHGWMDIFAAAAASLSRNASDGHHEHAHHLNTTFDGMARCARGVDAMLRMLNPAPVEMHDVPVTQPLVNSRHLATADPDSASEAPAAARRRSPPPGRRKSSS